MSTRFEAIKCDFSVVTVEGYHHVHLSDAASVAAVIQEFLQRQLRVTSKSSLLVAPSKL